MSSASESEIMPFRLFGVTTPFGSLKTKNFHPKFLQSASTEFMPSDATSWTKAKSMLKFKKVNDRLQFKNTTEEESVTVEPELQYRKVSACLDTKSFSAENINLLRLKTKLNMVGDGGCVNTLASETCYMESMSCATKLRAPAWLQIVSRQTSHRWQAARLCLSFLLV